MKHPQDESIEFLSTWWLAKTCQLRPSWLMKHYASSLLAAAITVPLAACAMQPWFLKTNALQQDNISSNIAI